MASEAPIVGAVFEATPKGFQELLRAANTALASDRQLVAVVQIGSNQLGAVFVRRAPKTGDSFFEEVL